LADLLEVVDVLGNSTGVGLNELAHGGTSSNVVYDTLQIGTIALSFGGNTEIIRAIKTGLGLGAISNVLLGVTTAEFDVRSDELGLVLQITEADFLGPVAIPLVMLRPVGALFELVDEEGRGSCELSRVDFFFWVVLSSAPVALLGAGRRGRGTRTLGVLRAGLFEGWEGVRSEWVVGGGW